MKKKIILLASTIISSVVLAAATIVSINTSTDDSRILAAGNIENQTITFDASHLTPVTEHGNEIASSIAGSMRRVSNYVCGMYSASNDAQFYTDTSIQSISRIDIRWSCKTLYELYFKVGTTRGGSNIYSANKVSIMGSQSETTTTITISKSSEAHFFSVNAKKFDSTSNFYIRSIVITYSCSY